MTSSHYAILWTLDASGGILIFLSIETYGSEYLISIFQKGDIKINGDKVLNKLKRFGNFSAWKIELYYRHNLPYCHIGFWQVLLMLKSRTTTVYYQPPLLAMLENIKVPPLTDTMFYLMTSLQINLIIWKVYILKWLLDICLTVWQSHKL